MVLTLLSALLNSASPLPDHRAFHDVPYRRVGSWQGQLDIYVPKTEGPRPALIYFHGGGWQGGDRKSVADHLAPYLARGFVVTAVGYRGSRIALAPAAVTDARCAYHWIVNNASLYGIDRTKITLSGHSAGGHLALITGYLTPAAGLDAECRSHAAIKPAAVVAWNAPSDLKQYMIQRIRDGDPIKWLQPAEKSVTLAPMISPIRYARRGAPPTISVHAIADPEIPYAQAARLHSALRRAGVRNELVTLRSKGHLTPQHPAPEVARAYGLLFRFLCHSGAATWEVSARHHSC